MTPPLRPYQARALDQLRAAWRRTRRVCVVMPTGAGKTRLFVEVIALRLARAPRALVVVHRVELLRQAAERLGERVGAEHVGLIAPGARPRPSAPVQVGTVQTLLARDLPPADTVVLDECHHYAPGSPEWASVLGHYGQALLLGVTATPERSDGSPLGDVYGELIVGAHYSELLASGALVPCVVLQPPDALGSRGLALDPVEAYQRHGEGRTGFVFCRDIEHADSVAAQLTAAGVPSASVTAETPPDVRAARIAALASGALRLLTSVQALTEGVDVPSASVCILARSPGHVSTYLQMVGRVLRSHPGKRDALLIDLAGASLTHGLPTEDRAYSLAGEGCARAAADVPIRVCQRCGVTWGAESAVCPSCGYVAPTQERRAPVIYDVELRRVYAGEQTPQDAQDRERHRLYAVAAERGWSAGRVMAQLKELFGGEPLLHDAPDAMRDAELRRLWTVAQERGYREGWVGHQYRIRFGRWPRKVAS